MKIAASQTAPLSVLDRLSLPKPQEQMADRFYATTCELAERCGVSDLRYQAGPGLTNLDEVSQLWWLQARHGQAERTLASLPLSLLTGLAGGLGGTPF